jgi:hypothetical protein
VYHRNIGSAGGMSSISSKEILCRNNDSVPLAWRRFGIARQISEFTTVGETRLETRMRQQTVAVIGAGEGVRVAADQILDANAQ